MVIVLRSLSASDFAWLNNFCSDHSPTLSLNIYIDMEGTALSGEIARLPLLWPGFDSRAWRNMQVEFVLVLAPRGFLYVLVFLPPRKLRLPGLI